LIAQSKTKTTYFYKIENRGSSNDILRATASVTPAAFVCHCHAISFAERKRVKNEMDLRYIYMLMTVLEKERVRNNLNAYQRRANDRKKKTKLVHKKAPITV